MGQPVSAKAAPDASSSYALPQPRRVPFDAPWMWLAAGWRDMWLIPSISVAYGLLFAILASAMVVGLWLVGALSVLPAVAGGLILMGPFVAVGLYEASRQLSHGERPTGPGVVRAGLRRSTQLAFFGAFLLFAFMVWMQMALILLMLFLAGNAVPPTEALMQTLLFTPHGLLLLIVGTIVGAAIAIVVFASSAVAIPMLLDRPVDAVSAARGSIRAVIQNPKPMALWAVLIAGLTVLGLTTLLVGFVFVFPLIGHATWHAYQAIYGDDNGTS
jgi:uncharacterized membrane protein